MKVVDPERMRQMDRKAIEGYGVPGIVLMENAGRGVAEAILERYPHVREGRVSVVCGKGNNGGDGFVVARHLRNRGVHVEVFLLSREEDVKGDALTNLKVWKAMGGGVTVWMGEDDVEASLSPLRHSRLIVDAIFGTGLDHEPSGVYGRAIDILNALPIPVVSVDIPSGLHGRSGRPLGRAVRADMTVTMALPKLGCLIYPGLEYTGELRVVDIGMPKEVMEEVESPFFLIEDDMVRGMMRRRKGDTHKGETGHLLIVAGSKGKTGAAAMTALGALRVGAGLVTLGIPESLNPVLEEKLTEAMTFPLRETPDATISSSAVDDIRALMKTRKAIAIGPGLTVHPDVREVVLWLLRECALPMVLDADAINCLVGELDVLRGVEAPVILTPHPGEMARLVGMTPQEVQERRVEIAQEFAVEYGVYLILKGARTLVAEPGGKVYINPTGNPGMATGGVGDVLTGVIGGLLVQGYSPIQASIMGVYLHGLAGDRVADERGGIGMVATDIAHSLPKVIKGFLSRVS